MTSFFQKDCDFASLLQFPFRFSYKILQLLIQIGKVAVFVKKPDLLQKGCRYYG